MEDVVAALYCEAEQFLEEQSIDGDLQVREDELIIGWYDEFDRMIYSSFYRDRNDSINDRFNVGIMLQDEKPAGSVGFYSEHMGFSDVDCARSIWSFCYEHAQQYDETVLETRQAGRFL